MVLAAGLGTRLRPLTRLLAKPALPVLNRPLLHWTLERLAQHGVKRVVINLHHLPETVVAAAQDGRAFGLDVRYSLEPRILGTGGGLRQARRLLGNDPLLVVNGDVAFDFDLGRLMARHHASGARATLALQPNPDPRQYGPVVTDASGRILSLAGRPRPARGRVSLFTGIHVLDPALLDRLPSGRCDSVRDLYAPLVEAGERLLGVRVRGAWYDLGAPRSYLESQLEMLATGFGGRPRRACLVDATARIAAGARVVRSVVGPGAVVEAGARIERSLVWGGVRVGRGARVNGSVVAADVAPGASVEEQVVVPGRRTQIG